MAATVSRVSASSVPKPSSSKIDSRLAAASTSPAQLLGQRQRQGQRGLERLAARQRAHAAAQPGVGVVDDEELALVVARSYWPPESSRRIRDAPATSASSASVSSQRSNRSARRCWASDLATCAARSWAASCSPGGPPVAPLQDPFVRGRGALHRQRRRLPVGGRFAADLLDPAAASSRTTAAAIAASAASAAASGGVADLASWPRRRDRPVAQRLPGGDEVVAVGRRRAERGEPVAGLVVTPPRVTQPVLGGAGAGGGRRAAWRASRTASAAASTVRSAGRDRRSASAACDSGGAPSSGGVQVGQAGHRLGVLRGRRRQAAVERADLLSWASAARLAFCAAYFGLVVRGPGRGQDVAAGSPERW